MRSRHERDRSRLQACSREAELGLARRLCCAVAAAAILVAPTVAHGAGWQLQNDAGELRPSLLAVPYVAQEELLCGGAAAAMVQRYWGVRQDAAAYAHLVRPERGGIPTVELVGALRRDDWSAVPFSGSARAVQDQLAAGRPVIALLQAGRDRYHYVVVVAWINDRVVLHDPAIGPFRVLPLSEFERAWAAAGRWSLLVLPHGSPHENGDGPTPHKVGTRPPANGRPDAVDRGATALRDGEHDRRLGPGGGPSLRSSGAALPAGSSPLSPFAADDNRNACGPLLRSGIEAASSGDASAAEERFRVALAACPESPGALRELAGLRFRQERWADAERLAGEAIKLEPDNRYTRQLLASARFLAGDRDGALDDWNALNEPRVDLVEVQGQTRTRHPVVLGLLDLHPGELLIRNRLVRARRRLSELPTAGLTRLRYEPPREGRSSVVAAVVERPLLPTAPLAIGATVARAAAEGEVAVPLTSPTGGAEAWTPWWRWGDGRSGFGLNVAFPAPAGLGAVWSIDVGRQEEVFARGGAAPSAVATPGHPALAAVDAGAPQEASLDADVVDRTHIGLTIADWLGPDIRWEVRSGWDRWQRHGQHLFVGSGLERRLAEDRLALRLDLTAWTPSATGGAFVEGGGGLSWRSTTDAAASPSDWHATAGVRAVGGDAPLDLWPGAGQGELREPLLRAHPLVEDGAIRPGGVGRSLLYGTVEYRRRLVRLGPIGLGAAVFTDAARIGQPTPVTDAALDSELEVDAGAGLRLRLPGQPGLLRLDLAHGLLDGATSISAGWIVDWR